MVSAASWYGRAARPVLCGVALALTFSEYWLLNYCAFPLFDTVFIWTRELSAAVGGLVLAILALASFWHAGPVRAVLFTAGVPVAMLAGAVCVAAGVRGASPILVALGASAVTVGSGLANIYVGLGCVGMGRRGVVLAVTGAYVASFAARWIFGLLPDAANLALFTFIPLVSLACVLRYARRFFAESAETLSPAHLSVTSPQSFVPFGHQVFLTLVIFRFVYGYTLVFGEVGRVPVVAPWALALLGVILAAIVAVLGVRRDVGPAFPDLLFKLSILLSVAGFLFVPLAGGARDAAAQALLAAGTGVFEIVMYYVLIALGTKNPKGALPALAWGNALASWGTIVGAAFGRLANHADGATLGFVSAGIVLALVGYALFLLPRFSFAGVLAGVGPAQDVHLPQGAVAGGAGVGDGASGAGGASAAADACAGDVADSWDRRCAALADQAGLTDREREVFELLAHGRNARFIQDTLAISYSTTKTHVSHIYQKMGVHAHQELLDLVERGPR